MRPDLAWRDQGLHVARSRVAARDTPLVFEVEPIPVATADSVSPRGVGGTLRDLRSQAHAQRVLGYTQGLAALTGKFGHVELLRRF